MASGAHGIAAVTLIDESERTLTRFDVVRSCDGALRLATDGAIRSDVRRRVKIPKRWNC